MFSVELQGVRFRVAFEHEVLRKDPSGQHRRITRCNIWPVDATDQPRQPGCQSASAHLIYRAGEAFDRSKARKRVLGLALDRLVSSGFIYARTFTKTDRRRVWREYLRHCPPTRTITLRVRGEAGSASPIPVVLNPVTEVVDA